MRISRAPRAAAAVSHEWVTGDVRVEELAAPEGPSRTQVDSVRFAPGARTRWHRHPAGQVLVVTEGTGLVQRRGGQVETIRTGDAVQIEPGEWHWHGATPTAALTHLAVEELPADGRTAELAQAVTDAEHKAGHCGGPGEQAGPAAPLSRVVVMDQELPRPLATHRVEIRRISIAPGHAGGLHTHNGPVFGSIEAGSAVCQIEGEPETVLKPGDVFHEPEGARIARFDAQADGVTFLAYYLLADGLNAELAFPET
jgi:quercetin dioxygenase-like cupin family protein